MGGGGVGGVHSLPMDDRAQDIAGRALQHPAYERQAFLDGACGGDTDLRSRVALIIESAGGATGEATLSGATAELGPGAEAPEGMEGPGTVIGHYKILQLIGEGGFGNVYMAQQSHPVKRKVAMKIVKPGMDSKQVIGRFESERQALAMMDHPNIARVFDAGTLPSGRPYFVMELVKGVPITEYCNTAQLTPAQRLDLFIDVCHAVQHAHFKGIIHRDLKPSNVLVTLHDDKPVVKVIDFGIAKAMNQELTDRTVFTEFKQFIGTPEYMSPEQAAMNGLDVDARTDIYSLGVLLYELMAGSTPFDSRHLRGAGYAEIQRIIREDEPPRPSTRVTRVSRTGHASRAVAPAPPDGTTTAEVIARQRRTDPRSLSRLLAGDLDWIVMKAMEKDRSRRYDTASAMADDIRRYLNTEPILARPPSTAYRLRKFARRNRIALGAAGGVLCALLLTLAALGYGLNQARLERDMTAERETVTSAQILLSNMNAVRKYTTEHVRPALQAESKDYNTNFVREMVPGFSARLVYSNFKQNPQYTNFVYKEASPNPTNRDNTADDFENGLIAQFKADGQKKELQGIRDIGGVRHFYIARPMPIADARCLDCHTTPETAPPRQVEIYGREGGYGWKMNDIIATQVVYVPVSEAFRMQQRPWAKVMGISALVLAIGGGLISLALLRKG